MASAATLKCHAVSTGHDIPPYYSTQLHGQPQVLLSIEVKCHTGRHNYTYC